MIDSNSIIKLVENCNLEFLVEKYMSITKHTRWSRSIDDNISLDFKL